MTALPTFFIIGAAKAGTTSLHYYLDQHPQIQMSATKEPHFFAGPEQRHPLSRRNGSAASTSTNGSSTRPSRCGARPRRATRTRPAGRACRSGSGSCVPEAKFVYLVRDPIDAHRLALPHAVAWARSKGAGARRSSEIADPALLPACHSLYATQLELYLRRFPAERMMVVDQAELLSRTAGRRCAGLCLPWGRGRLQLGAFGAELWATSARRVSPPGQATFIAGAVAPRTRWVPSRRRKQARRAYERAFWPPLDTDPLDEGSRLRLQEFYGEDVERLRTLTGKPFSSWSV